MSDGVREAYAAHAREKAKLIVGGVLVCGGVGVIPFRLFAHRTAAGVLFILSLTLFPFGLAVLRSTAVYKANKKGPRIPRRIRLPFDSAVEISMAQSDVQGRTDLAVAGRPPDEGEAPPATGGGSVICVTEPLASR